MKLDEKTNLEMYEYLAHSIIRKAAKDYRKALRILRRYPAHERALKEKQSIERFFQSDWFDVLSCVDGVELMRKLQEEV